MASFTTRERLIKLYTEHGYVSPTPKKFVPRRTRKKKKTSSKGVQGSSKKTASQVFSGVSSKQTLTGKSDIRNTALDSRPKKASTHRARKAITKKKRSSDMFSFIKVKSAGSHKTPVVTPKITAMPSPSLKRHSRPQISSLNDHNKVNANKIIDTNTTKSNPVPTTKLIPSRNRFKSAKKHVFSKKGRKKKKLPFIRVAIFCAFKSAKQLVDHPGSLNIQKCLVRSTKNETVVSHKASELPLTEDVDCSNCGEVKKTEQEDNANYPPQAIFDVKLINAQSIRTGGLAEFDVVVFPGGSSARQAQALNKSGRDAVRAFIAAGGGFVGVCAGAFLALSNYCPERSLKLVSAGAILKQNNAKFHSPIRKKLRKNSKAVTKSLPQNAKVEVIDCRPRVDEENIAEKSLESRSPEQASSLKDQSYLAKSNVETKVPAKLGKPKRSWEWGHGYVNVKFTEIGRKLLWDEGKPWESEEEEIEKSVIRMRYNNGPVIRSLDPPLIGSFCRSMTCLATFDSGIVDRFENNQNMGEVKTNENVHVQNDESCNKPSVEAAETPTEKMERKGSAPTSNDSIKIEVDTKSAAIACQTKERQVQRSTILTNYCAIAYAKPRVPHDRRRTGSVVLVSPHPESTTGILSKQNVSNIRYKRLVQRLVILASGADPSFEGKVDSR